MRHRKPGGGMSGGVAEVAPTLTDFISSGPFALRVGVVDEESETGDA